MLCLEIVEEVKVQEVPVAVVISSTDCDIVDYSTKIMDMHKPVISQRLQLAELVQEVR